jgi:chromate transporter
MASEILAAPAPAQEAEPEAPHESYGKLFLRFLRYGFLAWGGPVAQIAMIRQDLVEEERWVSRERFNRVLAVYQVLPGPEATELCVYFGMLSRGRLGAVLAGLGFVLPGFLMMFALSWFYLRYGIASPIFGAIFFGFKPAVAALIVRSVHRIGQHALTSPWLWAVAVGTGIATLFDVYFVLSLVGAGLAYSILKRVAGTASPAHALLLALPLAAPAAALAAPSVLALFGYGLRTGLLTFGGAYTAIPFLQHDAVEVGRWMSNAEFVDGLALSGILPAPLIIFTTFVGYKGGGAAGAVALTAGAFLPAFSFTLIGHNFFERIIHNKLVHTFLDGVTAGVIGLIVVTCAELIWSALPDRPAELALTTLIFVLGLAVLYRWKSKLSVLAVILGGGLLGALSLLLQQG